MKSGMKTMEGGCHCGRVRFRVTADLDGVTYCNCSICTKKGFLHLIVPPEQFDFWLGGEETARTAAELIAPAPDGSMKVYEVSPAVNKVENDSPALLEPYAPPADQQSKTPTKAKRGVDDRQGSLF